MNNKYLIYEKIDCRFCKGSGILDKSLLEKANVCSVCEGSKYSLELTDLKKAVSDLLYEDHGITSTIYYRCERYREKINENN